MLKSKKHLFLKFSQDLEKFRRTRRMWLFLSLFMFLGVSTLILFWKSLVSIDSNGLWWTIGSIGFIISMNWWYWTMRLVRRILDHQAQVIEILADITEDIQEIKIEVSEIFKK